jgi:hypothetical protein
MDDGWTTFVFPLRKDKPWEPKMEKFWKFLCHSVAFTQNIRLIQLFVDKDDEPSFRVSRNEVR